MGDGLYESFVHSLGRGVNGTVWVAHGRTIPGITFLDGYQSRTFEFQNGIRPFDRLYGDARGGAWGLTPTGFFLVDAAGHPSQRSVAGVAGAIAAQPLADGRALLLMPDRLLVYDFAHDTVATFWDGRSARLGPFTEMSGNPDSGLWLAGERGVGRLRRVPGRPEHEWEWIEFQSWPQPLTAFRYLAAVDARQLFVTATAARDSHVILRYDGRRWQQLYRTANALARAWPGADETVWMEDGDHLYRTQGDSFRPADPSAVLSDAIREVLPEPDGAFWLSTNDGLVRGAPLLWRAPDGAGELQVPVYAAEKDGAGGLWFLLQDRFLHYSGARWESIPIPEHWHPMLLRSGGLLVMRDGSIAALTPERKILRFDPVSRRFSETAPPGNASIEAFSLRGDGTAWVATRQGGRIALSVYDGHLHPRDDLRFDWDASGILLVAQTSDGSIWIGGTNRLAVYRNGQFRVLGAKDGYSDTGVFSILEVQPGRVWFGGRRSVMEWDGRAWKVLRRADRTRAIIRANDGSVWTASTDGVFHYRGGVWLEYGQPEGLPSSIAYSIREDTAGHIWSVTTRGIGVFHPEADPDPPRAFLEPGQNPSQVPPGEVRILISAVDKWNYTAPDRMLCSHRIDDRPWSAFEDCRPAVYRALAKGAHHFEVVAMDRNGNRSLQPAAFDFSVVPPWYLSTGFFLSAGGAVAVIAGLLLLVTVNYTHRGRLIAQLRKANSEIDLQRERAEQASISKGLFLANMSHEIRTPMNGVLGMAELARQAEAPGERDEYLRSLQQSARSLLGILNDILDLSKIEAGKVELAQTRFRLRDCLAEALQPLAVTAGQKNLEVILRLAPDLPNAVIGDSVRLRQVLVNLLGNAVKFTRAGEVALDVSVRESAPGKVLLRFCVRDTGPGIPPEKRQVIFQAFEQAGGSSRDFGGAGLGLAIAARFVKMMGGRIIVESPPAQASSAGGPGTEFRFDAAFSLPADEPANASTAFTGLEAATVLIVEDNASARTALAEAMARAGVRVATASDAAEALRQLESAAFAAVIVDQTLPDVNGSELAYRIRLHRNGADARIVLLKSVARQGSSAVHGHGSVNATFYKPVDAMELLHTIAALMQAPPPAMDREQTSTDVPPRSSRPLRVLVAEDNAVNQLVVRGLLEKRGHHVEIACDGDAAIAAAANRAFDVILMDLEMPVTNGWQATAAIRAREAASGTRRIAIVALTAHAMKGHDARCREAGMDAYITKPIEVGALDAVLEEVSRNLFSASNL